MYSPSLSETVSVSGNSPQAESFAVTPSMMSLTGLTMLFGRMEWRRLCARCLSRRRLVSRIACAMESVTVSAYKITRPLMLRAARPMV